VAGFFVDMAVHNPDRPGEFLAGIECDGASYHSGFSVRDRDRIRQEILESLGWRGRIYRIWSTDWFYNPHGQTARLRAFLEERRRISAEERSLMHEDNEDVVEDAAYEQPAETAPNLSTIPSIEVEDLFVELGDRVTYCLLDAPEERHTVMIVDSESNARMGIINERTPLARALLGCSLGDIAELDIAGNKIRQLRVLKIQRQENLLAS